MELLGSLGGYLLVPLLFIVGMVVLAARRGFQMKLLVQDGVETTGTVVQKLTFRGKHGSSTHRIRYQYVDQSGQTHSHRSTVTDDVFRGSAEGSSFPVVYSRSKPHVSAPKYLVDQSRVALAK